MDDSAQTNNSNNQNTEKTITIDTYEYTATPTTSINTPIDWIMLSTQ